MVNRKQSVFEDLIDLTALLPWWAGLLLALISYFLIHPFAVEPVPSATGVKEAGEMVSKNLIRSFAIFGQYLFPAVFLMGTAVSAMRSRKRNRLLATTAEATSQGAIKALSWREFEILVGEVFRCHGYTVQQTAGGADGGVDLELKKNGEKQLVQCKQWRATKVGVTTVRELFGVMAACGAVGAFIVTSGVFTREAKSFAEGRNITLIDGRTLDEMVRLAKRKSTNSSIFSNAAERGFSPPANDAIEAVPDCPACGSPMVKRVARRGNNVGKAFWGCVNFPNCRGTKTV